MDEIITQNIIKAAVDKDYVSFKDNMIQLTQAKVDNHPGVQAYREDMRYYKDFSSAMGGVSTDTVNDIEDIE